MIDSCTISSRMCVERRAARNLLVQEVRFSCWNSRNGTYEEDEICVVQGSVVSRTATCNTCMNGNKNRSVRAARCVSSQAIGGDPLDQIQSRINSKWCNGQMLGSTFGGAAAVALPNHSVKYWCNCCSCAGATHIAPLDDQPVAPPSHEWTQPMLSHGS